MSLTITIPGAVNVTTGAMAPAVLTIGVGVPGAQGPQGPAGQGVPAGGSAGQFLQKIDGVSYNTDWVTVNLGAYAVKANNLSDLTSASTARTNLGLGTMATATATDYSTTTAANGLYYPLTGNPSSFLTASALTGYATQSFVAANYAPIAAGLPTGGTVGQVLTKNSGTNFDVSFQTLIPGDRYLTTSSTSNTIGNGAKTFTVGTGLSYSSQQDVVISYDASNHMHALVTSYNSGTGVLVVDVQHHTGSGTYTAWTVNVGGTTPLQSVEWGEILGVLGDQSDLASALSAKLETSTAASTYAALAGATFTGEVVTPASTTSNAGLTITPGVAPTTPTNGEIWATTNDLQVRLNGVTETVAEQSWVTAGFYPLSGNPSGFLVSSALTPYALLSGATFTGLVGTVASTTTTAGLRIPHGAAPTTPTNGDVWTTTSGLFARINGGTQQYAPLGSTNTFTGTNTFSGATVFFGTSTAASTINVGTGATLTATTKAVNIGTNGVAGSTTNIAIGSATSTTTTTVEGTVTLNGTTLNLGNSTAASTINVGSGATISGATKTVSIGNGGVSGSTTNVNIANTIGAPSGAATINIGVASGPPTTTTNLNGTVNATTAAADTNSTVVATTAYVVGQAGSATPLVNGTAAVGTSLRYARQDHVHGTDTTRAPLASPSFTGVPLAPTATLGTNTTQLATTAFVTAAVPSLATFAQSIPTTLDTTRAVTPAGMMFNRMYGGFIDVPRIGMNYVTSGTGAQMFLNGHLGSLYLLASTANTSNARGRIFGTSQADEQLQYLRKDSVTQNQGYNFSNMMWLSGRIAFVNRDANVVIRVTLGKADTAGVGDLASKGIGVRKVGSTGAIQLTVHNGTTLTNVSSSTTAEGVYDIDVISLGDGNVNLYIDRVLAATTSSGPTGNTSVTTPTYQEEIESTAIPTIGNGYVVCTRMKYYSS